MIRTPIQNIRQSLSPDDCQSVIECFCLLNRVADKVKMDRKKIDKFLIAYISLRNGRRKNSQNQPIWNLARVDEIAKLRESKMPWKDIADKYGCADHAVAQGFRRYRR